MVAGRYRRGGAGDTAAGRAGGSWELEQERRERSREGGSAGGGDLTQPRSQGSTATCWPHLSHRSSGPGQAGPGCPERSHTSKIPSFLHSDSQPYPRSSSPTLFPSSLTFPRHLRSISTWPARVPGTWGTTGSNKGKQATPKQPAWRPNNSRAACQQRWGERLLWALLESQGDACKSRKPERCSRQAGLCRNLRVSPKTNSVPQTLAFSPTSRRSP